MCIQLVERYAGCGCLYFEHSVDPCSAINTLGHEIQVKEVPVGYTCNYHAPATTEESGGNSSNSYADSGYGSDERFRR